MGDFTLQPNVTLSGANIGDALLSVEQPENIASIAPLKGQQKATALAVKKYLKCALPAVGEVKWTKSVTVSWVGHGQWFAFGKVDGLADALADIAAVTDQSDAWMQLRITGLDAAEVMARITPLDIRAMVIGQTARAEFAHMPAAITPIEGGYEVMVMRSFAKTAVDHTIGVMKRLAAQRALPA